MKLYSAGPSPFARKVHVLLAETDQTDAVETVTLFTSPTDTHGDVAAKNPLGKIPLLERDGGPALYDSRVICRYLDDLAGGRLYPQAPRLWETLTLEATGDGIMDAAILMVYEGRCRAEDKRDPNWLDAQWTKITRALDALESRWMSHLAGPLDMGQITVGCALEYLDFRQPDRPWREGRPQLTAWQESFATRPAMIATKPE